MVPALEFWAGEGFMEFFKNGRTGDQIKLLGSPRFEELCRCTTGCDEGADEDIGVEDGLRHSIATASTGGSRLFHGVGGIVMRVTCRHGSVLGPYSIKNREESGASFR